METLREQAEIPRTIECSAESTQTRRPSNPRLVAWRFCRPSAVVAFGRSALWCRSTRGRWRTESVTTAAWARDRRRGCPCSWRWSQARSTWRPLLKESNVEIKKSWDEWRYKQTKTMKNNRNFNYIPPMGGNMGVRRLHHEHEIIEVCPCSWRWSQVHSWCMMGVGKRHVRWTK